MSSPPVNKLFIENTYWNRRRCHIKAITQNACHVIKYTYKSHYKRYIQKMKSHAKDVNITTIHICCQVFTLYMQVEEDEIRSIILPSYCHVIYTAGIGRQLLSLPPHRDIEGHFMVMYTFYVNIAIVGRLQQPMILGVMPSIKYMLARRIEAERQHVI